MFDEKDKKILDLIQKDASLAVGEIAETVGISKSACWRRIQKFEENGVILNRVTLLDKHQVGLSLSAYITVKTNQHNDEWEQRFNQLVNDIPEIIEVCRMSGPFDYLIKVVVKDMPAFDSLLRRLTSLDPIDVQSGFVIKTMKSTTQLPLE